MEETSDGIYSVASGYLSLLGRMEKPIWAKAWIPRLTPKINIFFWLLLQDKILTLDNLAKRGQTIPNRCNLYKHDLETVNHLFIHCPYSSKVWNQLTTDLGFNWCPLACIQDFFYQWRSHHQVLNSQLMSSWIFPHFWWGIWKERKNRIFRDRETPKFIIAEKTKGLILENFSITRRGNIKEGGNSKASKKDRAKRI